MKTWPLFISALITLSSTSFAHGTTVSIGMKDGAPQYAIQDTPLTRDRLSAFFIRDVQINSFILLALSPDVTTSIIFDLIKDIKQAGYETVYIGYSEIAPLDALPTRNITVQIDLKNTSIDEEEARRIKQLDFENEMKQKAQQGVPGYRRQSAPQPER